MLRTPTLSDFVAVLQMNLIKNNPILLSDIKLAKNIYRPNVGSIKGKTTQRKPLPVMEDLIDILIEFKQQQHKIILAVDGMVVNGLKFLTTISLKLFYHTAQYI